MRAAVVDGNGEVLVAVPLPLAEEAAFTARAAMDTNVRSLMLLIIL